MYKKIGLLAGLFMVMAGTGFAQIGIFTENSDIGDIGAEGAAFFSDGEYIIEGSGADIWETADEFHFLYKEMTGSFSIKTNTFLEIGGGDATWAKMGPMVRDNLTAGSPYAFAMIRAGGLDFGPQWRDAQDGSAASDDNAIVSGDDMLCPDHEGAVELERTGNTINYYYINSDCDRVLVYSHDVPGLEDPVYVGLAVTSHNDGQISTGYFSGVEITEYDWNVSLDIPVTSYSLSQVIEGVALNVNVSDGKTVDQLTVTLNVPADLSISNLSAVGDAAFEAGVITWTLSNISGNAALTFDLQAPTLKDYGNIPLTGEATDGTLSSPLSADIPPLAFNIYETFSYPYESPDTALADLEEQGGYNWASDWVDSGAASPNALDETVIEAGLVENQPAEYNPGGYCLRITGDAGNGVGRKIFPVSTGELWLSFVFMEEGPVDSHWSGMTLYSSGGSESSFIGKPYNSETCGIGNLPDGDSLTEIDYTVPNHFLVRYVLNSGPGQNDSVYLWINPDESDRMDTYDAGGENNDEIQDIAEIRLRRGGAAGSSYFDAIWLSSDPALPPAGAGRVDLTFNNPDRDPAIPVWDVISIDQYDDAMRGEPGFGHDSGNDYYLIVAGYLYYSSSGEAFFANGLPPDRMSGLNGHVFGPYNNQYLELGLKNSVKFQNNDAQRGPFTFNVVPAGKYSELRASMTVGNGYGVLKCTLNFEDGSTELTEIHADDWFRDPSDADWMFDDVTLLINGMDRLDGDSNFADANDPAVNEDAVAIENSDKVLVSIDLELDIENSGNEGNVGYNLYDIWCYPTQDGGTPVSDWSLF
ncbi:MAG: hypothetical protein JXR73_05805 [Candidatus Omnitrophica bacterium]|nr:hypothetical protein [Candidatus Omnitrophota bacterium]